MIIICNHNSIIIIIGVNAHIKDSPPQITPVLVLYSITVIKQLRIIY